MNFEKYAPNDFLKPFVQTFLIVESEDGMQKRILPSTSLVLSFRIRGSVTSIEENAEDMIPLLGLAGLRKQSREVRYSKGAAMLLVIFWEGAASRFFREPMHEIFGRNLSLDHLIDPAKIREIEERLFEAKTNLQRISLIQNLLISELRRPEQDPLVLDTIRKIRAAKGNLKIQELLKGMPISRDSFEKRFRRLIGTTPKQFSEIVRMKNVIDRYSPELTLTDTAYQAGYFDQAHFIKEFKIFTGQAPKAFFQSPPDW